MRPQSGATKGGTHVGQSSGPHGDTGGKEACARRRARARAPRSSPRRYPGRGGDPASAQEVGPVGTAESSGLGLGPQHCMRDPPRARGGRGVGPPLGVLAGSPPRPAIPEWPHWRLGPLPGVGAGGGGGGGAPGARGAPGPSPARGGCGPPPPGARRPPAARGLPPPRPSRPSPREREGLAVCSRLQRNFGRDFAAAAGIADRRRSSLRGGGGLGAGGGPGPVRGAPKVPETPSAGAGARKPRPWRKFPLGNGSWRPPPPGPERAA